MAYQVVHKNVVLICLCLSFTKNKRMPENTNLYKISSFLVVRFGKLVSELSIATSGEEMMDCLKMKY